MAAPVGGCFPKEHIGFGLTASNQGSSILDWFRQTGSYAIHMLNGDQTGQNAGPGMTFAGAIWIPLAPVVLVMFACWLLRRLAQSDRSEVQSLPGHATPAAA
jgi:hypothetical protein